MYLADVCYLISDTPAAHGIHAEPVTAERMVYCTVQSVSRSEYYQAANVGLQPNYVLKLSNYADYDDELKLRFRGKLYRIIRTYITPDHGIELTIQRSDING